MDFNHFKNNIKHLQNTQIGGLDWQFKLAPKMREKFDADLVLKNNPKKMHKSLNNNDNTSKAFIHVQ